MTAKITSSRPGVSGATRYMINDNLVFFHHFDETRHDEHPRVTIAYTFISDGVMLMSASVRKESDHFCRRTGNDYAFDRLLDHMSGTATDSGYTETITFEESLQPMVKDLLSKVADYVVCSQEREHMIGKNMTLFYSRKFRSCSHHAIRDFLESSFYGEKILSKMSRRI